MPGTKEQPIGRAISEFFKGNKSTKDLKELAREYPTDVDDYELMEDCGRGVSATVYRALCKPLNQIVAVKKMNLECMNCDLDEIIQEAQLMKNYNHPHVLPLFTSFVTGQDLWMVMPFISGGSILHIMKYAYPEGLEEVVVATIMRDVLKALDYVHRQGGIHRDIKAGNILCDKDGWVYLADFGVATSLDRTGSWGHDKGNRMTFVGTPCWMAPEVMEQIAGYDNAADIWSFGISLLEMAHGHAPFAKFPPMKVLLMTLQNPPPTLDDKGKKQFSKAMRDVVSKCLQKDPRLRPPASQLLEHKFFKQARDAEFLSKHLMGDLAPLGDRVQEIRNGKAATSSKDNDRDFFKSQEEYKKGVSSWNFDVAALKAQADLEDDDEPPLPSITEVDERDSCAGLGDATMTAQVPELVNAASAKEERLCNSAFGTLTGQAAAVKKGVHVTPLTVEASQSSHEHLPSVMEALASPSAASRESSATAPLSNLSPTLSSIALKKGRFSVYEGSEEPPPLTRSQPPSYRDLDSSVSLSHRPSEDGLKKESSTVSDQHDETISVERAEPKKKGRFTVIENGGSLGGGSKSTASLASLDSFKRNNSDVTLSGKPPIGPSAVAPPVAVVLPRLQELIDQAAQHQAALQKLMVAVQETERTGKASAQLHRALTPKSADSSATAEPDNPEELRAIIEQLRHRLADLELDNMRLKARNRELDSRQPSEGGSSLSMVASVTLSPHDSKLHLTPRTSHDDVAAFMNGHHAAPALSS